MEPLRVTFNLKTIHCSDEGDGPGDAEPYLWTVFFKLDGTTCSLDKNFMLSGKATVVGTPGSHGNLGATASEVAAGQTVPIPKSLGHFKTTLVPIPTAVPGLLVGGVVGSIAILMEEDSTPDSAANAGHAALNAAIQTALDSFIPTLGIKKPEPTDDDLKALEQQVSDAVTSAVASNVSFWDAVWGFLSFGNNQDDEVGTARFFFSHQQLEDSAATTISLSQAWQNEGSWQMAGTVTVAKAAYDAVWRPGNDTETQFYGRTFAQYQAAYDDLWKKGMRIYLLNTYVEAGDVLYDAVWRPGNDTETQFYGRTFAQYQAAYDDLWKKGMRIYLLNTYVVNGQVLYDAVWRPGNQGETQLYGRTFAQYQTAYDDLWKKGMRIHLLNTYVVNGQVLYDAVWRPGNQGETQAYGRTFAQYQTAYDDLWKKGMRIHLLNTYVVNGQVLYDAVWRPANQGETQFYGRTFAQYQAAYDDLWKKGLRIYLLNTFVIGS
jgi:hypothetical protein